ncbi:hypothetical protein QTN25_005783 [Entamoeba marina]
MVVAINRVEAAVFVSAKRPENKTNVLYEIEQLRMAYQNSKQEFYLKTCDEFNQKCDELLNSFNALYEKTCVGEQIHDELLEFLFLTHSMKYQFFHTECLLFEQDKNPSYCHIDLLSELFPFLPTCEDETFVEMKIKLVTFPLTPPNNTINTITNLIQEIENASPFGVELLKPPKQYEIDYISLSETLENVHFSIKQMRESMNKQELNKINSLHFTIQKQLTHISTFKHPIRKQFKINVQTLSKSIVGILQHLQMRSGNLNVCINDFIKSFALFCDMVSLFIERNKVNEYTQHLKTKTVLIVENLKIFQDGCDQSFIIEIQHALELLWSSIVKITYDCLYQNNHVKKIILACSNITFYECCLNFSKLMKNNEELMKALKLLNTDKISYLSSEIFDENLNKQLLNIIHYQEKALPLVAIWIINQNIKSFQIHKKIFEKHNKFLMSFVAEKENLYVRQWPFGRIVTILSSFLLYAELKLTLPMVEK